jgi:hypothetical protein
MAITADGDLRAGSNGAFEDAVIGRVHWYRVNGFGGRDERREAMRRRASAASYGDHFSLA